MKIRRNAENIEYNYYYVFVPTTHFSIMHHIFKAHHSKLFEVQVSGLCQNYIDMQWLNALLCHNDTIYQTSSYTNKHDSDEKYHNLS